MLMVVGAAFAATLAARQGQGQGQGQDDDLLARMFASYAKGDVKVIERSLTTSRAKDAVKQDVKSTLQRWSGHREPIQAVFLLDLAFVMLDLDVLDQARKFIANRPDPPGRNAAEDALEVAWLKAALPFIENQRRAPLLQERGIAPLKKRMTATLQPGGARLVDPWFALTCGIAEEQWMVDEPFSLRQHGEAAAKLLVEAGTFESTRAEALVRLSWVLVRLGRHEEALSALDAFGDRTNDTTLRYWSRLFRARAFEGLGRPDDAARAYNEALSLIPRAQSPTAALALLETRRGRIEDAERWAIAGRTAPAGTVDPWWQYGKGEYRLYEARMAALRARIQK
jgi:tetratricopeptide (TPR) repeat protein